MERIEHDLHQGEDDWHAFRLDHFGASELVFALGLSKKESRTGLMHAKKTGIARQFSQWLQENVLDRGHELEASARPIVARLIGKKLYPSTYSIGKISASVDGLTADGSTAWEHKQYNKEYFDMVAAGEVPEEHMPQCQQVLMVTGADKLIFTISDGTEENMVSTEVLPCPEWFEKIRATWAQFEIDLENYVPVEVIEKEQPDAIRQLPAVLIRASGGLVESNLHEMTPQYDAFIVKANANLAGINIVNGKAVAKFSRAAADDLKAKKKGLIDQIVTVSEAMDTMDLYITKFNKIGLDYEKAVDRMQEAEIEAALAKVGAEYIDHVDTLQIGIDPIKLIVEKPNFRASLARLQLPEKKNAALNAALANAKVAASTVAKDVGGKLFWFNSNHKEHILLFPDLQTVIYKLTDDFKLLVEARIAKHNAAEEDRRVAEREKIRIEEEAKAKAKIEADLEADREHQRKQQAIYLAKAKDEEEKAKRIQDDLDAAKARRVAADAAAVIEPIKHETLAPKEIVKNIVATVAQEMVTIPKEEYESLLDDAMLLQCLRNNGVDSWYYWGDAIDEFENMKEPA
jgi:predicted phage-related endonuclease